MSRDKIYRIVCDAIGEADTEPIMNAFDKLQAENAELKEAHKGQRPAKEVKQIIRNVMVDKNISDNNRRYMIRGLSKCFIYSKKSEISDAL